MCTKAAAVVLACLSAANAAPLSGWHLGDANATAHVGAAWCLGAPLDLKAGGGVEKRLGAEFRGSFQDFTLWVEIGYNKVRDCERFTRHTKGNDGLWVIEYDTEELMKTEVERIEKTDVPILKRHGLSLVVGGGESAADELGYDACGMEQDKRFISVSNREVRGPKKMAADRKEHFMALSKKQMPPIMDILELVSETSLLENIEHMQDYETRNSFSGSNGLDQAADWAAAQFSELGFVVTRDSFREDMTP